MISTVVNYDEPAQEKGHVEERREESEELKGEHLDCETSFCGSKCVCVLWRHTEKRQNIQKHFNLWDIWQLFQIQ